MKIEQILYKVFVVSQTDFLTINTLARNSLLILVFGHIEKDISKQDMFDQLGFELQQYYGNLSPIIEVVVDKNISDRINPSIKK